MPRLNKEIRSKIVENAYLNSSIPAAKKELTARSMDLSEKVRADGLETPTLDHDLKAAEKEIKLILKKRGVPDSQMPRKLFERHTNLYAHFGDARYTLLNFNGHMRERDHYSAPTLIEGGQLSESKFRGSKDVEYDANHPFTQEYRKLRDDALQLKEDEQILRKTVKGTVDSFNTTEKLLEHWPEAKVLLPKEVEKSSAPMPIAIQVDVLNNLIGLPK